MRISRLAFLLTGCAVLALTTPATAQDAPVVMDPPLISPVPQSPVVVPVPGRDAVAPEELRPPLVVPDEEPLAEPAEPAAPPIPAIWAPVPVDASGQSAYGLYLAGRLASIRGDRAAGSEFLGEAHALAPEQPALGEEAFRSGLFSGDIADVARLTPTVAATPDLAEAGRLVELVQALRSGNARQSLALLNLRPFADPFSAVARYLTPAVAGAAGDWDTALKAVDAPPTDPAGLILHQQRASLLESRRRFAEADAEYKVLLASPGGAMVYALDYAEFLERQGRRDEALAIYEAALTGGNPNSEALLGRARVAGRGRAPAEPDTLRRAADALEFAALQTSANQAWELSAIYLRMADSLHPGDLITLQLGQALAAGRQPLLASEAFARVSGTDPITYARAQVGLANALDTQGDSEGALDALRRADAAAADQAAFAYTLAGHLEGMGRHEEALAVLNRPTINVAGQPAQFRFLRGAVLENLNRIDEAEAELWAALQAQPNDPTILNYLGYMWVDSGRRVAEGAEMLARAHAADPQNGNIQDSLGWAQFRQGQYETAVQTLEEAVGKQPGNAEIVDHLGDAYWQVGRRREAEWQWTRVLTLDPDAERRSEVEQKLVRGLAEPTSVAAGGQP